jgi:hypothetical protein
MQQDDPVGEPIHPLDRVLTAAVHPVGVELEKDQARVGVGQNQVVDVVVSEALELLDVVVVASTEPDIAESR